MPHHGIEISMQGYQLLNMLKGVGLALMLASWGLGSMQGYHLLQ